MRTRPSAGCPITTAGRTVKNPIEPEDRFDVVEVGQAHPGRR
jgi:hypothetical protein